MITFDEVKRAAAEVVAENPDAVNPMNDNRTCLYNKRPDDITPNAADHCLGGTVLLKLGQKLPPEGKGVWALEPSGNFENEALSYLSDLQVAADNHGEPRAWSDALERTNHYFGV